jgi:hypothetical protein
VMLDVQHFEPYLILLLFCQFQPLWMSQLNQEIHTLCINAVERRTQPEKSVYVNNLYRSKSTMLLFGHVDSPVIACSVRLSHHTFVSPSHI